jgi:nucleoside-diphosphate-sugar epimerase
VTLAVTGGTGFIGRRLVARLCREGRPPRCLVRASSETAELEAIGAEIAVVDLETGAGVEGALEGTEGVIHLAGAVRAWTAEEYARANVDSTRHLVEAATKTGVSRFVLVSSLAAAGPSARDEALVETAEARPVGLYGTSKRAAEVLLAELAPPELCWSIVRPCIVYGPGDRDVFALIASCARGLGVWSAPSGQRVSMVHVDDVVELVTLCLDRASRGATYFCSDSEAHLWREVVETIAAALDRRVMPLRAPPLLLLPIAALAELTRLWRPRPPLLSMQKLREASQAGWVCSPEVARSEMGFEARLALEEGIIETVSWYREKGWF